jgi:hypothetical protein
MDEDTFLKYSDRTSDITGAIPAPAAAPPSLPDLLIYQYFEINNSS